MSLSSPENPASSQNTTELGPKSLFVKPEGLESFRDLFVTLGDLGWEEDFLWVFSEKSLKSFRLNLNFSFQIISFQLIAMSKYRKAPTLFMFFYFHLCIKDFQP
jgi:hypothetical protein